MAPESSPPYAARSTFRGISAVTACPRPPHRRSHRLQRLRNHLHLTPVLLSAELVRSQTVSDTRIVGHIDSNDSGIISTLRSRSTFRGISAVTACPRPPHRRPHRRRWLRNHLHLTQPVLLSAELVRSQPVSDTRIVGHIGSNDSGIISTLRSPLIQQVHHLLINSSLGSLN